MAENIIGFIQEPVRNETVAVGVASIIVSEPRKKEQNPRITILVRNTSAGGQVITVNLGMSVAVAQQGIVLKPNESYTDTTSEGYQSYQGGISAISDLAAGVLSIMER